MERKVDAMQKSHCGTAWVASLLHMCHLNMDSSQERFYLIKLNNKAAQGVQSSFCQRLHNCQDSVLLLGEEKKRKEKRSIDIQISTQHTFTFNKGKAHPVHGALRSSGLLAGLESS